jgi:alkaline phosphatase D
MDARDGYKASRDRIVGGIVARGVRNPIVLTGDLRQNYADDIKADFDDPGSAAAGSEFVGTSISSGGDTAAQLAANSHLKFNNRQRGYVRCQLTPTLWRADFRMVPYVTAPGAPVATRASCAGQPGFVPA